MPRNPEVAGGRPIRVPVRFSEQEADALDHKRGPLDRSTYIRQAVADSRPAHNSPRPPPEPTPAQGQKTHIHKWRQANQYLDQCDCGQDRPHQAGTR